MTADSRLREGDSLCRVASARGDAHRAGGAVPNRVRDSGEAWFGGSTVNGTRAMRVSVVNHRTTDHNVDRAVAAVREALVSA